MTEKISILIIDDEVVSCKKLAEILESYGSCKEFYDGKDAISYYETILKEGKNINLITLDIAMPQFDGIDTLEALRALEKKYSVEKDNYAKIIMVTCSFDKVKITDSFEKGCTDYIIKPFDEKKLLTRLKNNNLL